LNDSYLLNKPVVQYSRILRCQFW